MLANAFNGTFHLTCFPVKIMKILKIYLLQILSLLCRKYRNSTSTT